MTESSVRYRVELDIDALWVEAYGRPPTSSAEGRILLAATALAQALGGAGGDARARAFLASLPIWPDGHELLAMDTRLQSLSAVIDAVFQPHIQSLQDDLAQMRNETQQLLALVHHRKVSRKARTEGFVPGMILVGDESARTMRLARAARMARCVDVEGQPDVERWLRYCEQHKLNPERWQHSKGKFS